MSSCNFPSHILNPNKATDNKHSLLRKAEWQSEFAFVSGAVLSSPPTKPSQVNKHPYFVFFLFILNFMFNFGLFKGKNVGLLQD